MRKMILSFLLFFALIPLALAETREDIFKQQQLNELKKLRAPKYHFGYIEKVHSTKQYVKDIAFAYAFTWVIYPLTQPSAFRKKGSWDKYKDNFGEIVFDHDAPFWNVMVHPISGSQLYLYYRANGYTRGQSFLLTFVSSALFEFTVEIYTEPASVPDLIQTPVLGSVLGYAIENLSMYLLNTGNPIGRVLGHMLNPTTLFWFYDGKMRLTPNVGPRGEGLISFYMDF